MSCYELVGSRNRRLSFGDAMQVVANGGVVARVNGPETGLFVMADTEGVFVVRDETGRYLCRLVPTVDAARDEWREYCSLDAGHPPRYDEVHADGVAWLAELEGES